MYSRWFLGPLTTLALVIGAVPVHGASLDSTLFTTYTMNTARTNLNWLVCGSLPGTYGCYGSGFLGTFGKIGAMVEGFPAQNLSKGTVTRYIYVVDENYASGLNGVALFVYKKVDTIAGGGDTITVTLFKTVLLPLTGGTSTVSSMAANQKFLYLGTNQDVFAVQLKKSTFAISQYAESGTALGVDSITADHYGFITTTWIDKTGSPSIFDVIDPNGLVQEEGGGSQFMLNTIQAVRPTTLP
jgi:hypothetical protein